jgi:hypothetical protein
MEIDASTKQAVSPFHEDRIVNELLRDLTQGAHGFGQRMDQEVRLSQS